MTDHNGDAEPRTILFDLDGTLIDTIELIVAAAKYAFAGRDGPAPSETEIRSTIGRPLTIQFAQWLVDESDLPRLIARYREYQLEHHDRLTTVYDGIPAAVAALHAAGCPMGIVTSKIGFMAERALVHVGLRDYMRVVIAADSTTKHKPDPEPVLVAMSQLGACASNTVFVGDSPYDMMAGVAAGVESIGVSWGGFTTEALRTTGASRILDHPSELPQLIGH